ncbi:MAG: Peptidyl-prolyl cis-trans isomerase pin4 [Vezdaea aestivalis]|nr:MAG: Peptidyl-prolyl cis-trans isomerase pin4 [Vezdaea aestivalis]
MGKDKPTNKGGDKKKGQVVDKKGKAKEDANSTGSSSGKLKAATSINSRHILCEKHSKKEEALTKLQDGAKFDEVAKEFSEDKARQGGSLGWKTRGSLDAEFEKVAYDLEPSTTASPKYAEVKTGHGYHIIMVEGRK